MKTKVLSVLPEFFAFRKGDYGKFIERRSYQEVSLNRWNALGKRLSNAIVEVESDVEKKKVAGTDRSGKKVASW